MFLVPGLGWLSGKIENNYLSLLTPPPGFYLFSFHTHVLGGDFKSMAWRPGRNLTNNVRKKSVVHKYL